MTFHETAQVFATIGLIVATLVLGLFTLALWRASRRIAAATEEATALQRADVARRGLELRIVTARMLLRANVQELEAQMREGMITSQVESIRQMALELRDEEPSLREDLEQLREVINEVDWGDARTIQSAVGAEDFHLRLIRLRERLAELLPIWQTEVIQAGEDAGREASPEEMLQE